ncbi:MAG: hypothetical protein HY518_01780 [Candidatus Aenigmarchaeota archaeon]|nr:hypothetical protein [Candidatus Aenigmarchaeota archaeon]
MNNRFTFYLNGDRRLEGDLRGILWRYGIDMDTARQEDTYPLLDSRQVVEGRRRQEPQLRVYESRNPSNGEAGAVIVGDAYTEMSEVDHCTVHIVGSDAACGEMARDLQKLQVAAESHMHR